MTEDSYREEQELEHFRGLVEDHFVECVDTLSGLIFQDNVDRGWWDMGVENRNKPEMIALMHSEFV